MIDLKIGDLVQIDEYTAQRIFSGVTLLEVIKVDENDTNLRYKLALPGQTNGCWIPTKNILKRIDQRNRKMKAGDKIRLTDEFIINNSNNSWVQECIDQIMTIDSIICGGRSIIVKENIYSFSPDWIELVDKSVTPKKTSHKKSITINLMNNHKLLTNIKLN